MRGCVSDRVLTLVVAIACVLLTAAPAFSAVVCYLDSDNSPYGVDMPGITSPVAALDALASPPAGYTSAIPPSTRVVSFIAEQDYTTVDFSQAILAYGMTESRLESIFDQVRNTLEQFSLSRSIRMTAQGAPLYQYLPPTPDIAPGPESGTEPVTSVVGLAGKKIGFSPGHGQRWTGSSWLYERPVYCYPLLCEDDHNDEIVRYLDIYLRQDGATTKVYRCIDKSAGNYANGNAWWRMSAPYWLKNKGYPCSVYASNTGDCNLGSGGNETDDGVRSRPLASDYDNTDIYIAHHTNGYKGDCTGSDCGTGTVTYYDASTEHATWGAISKTLAEKVQAAICSAIKTKYTDSTWYDRHALDSDGAYGEIRIPNRAAILIELGFHDTCDHDALYLKDNFFRSTCMWATYKGVCDYFAVTPTWDYYSYEVVSNDIPDTMNRGETTTAHITLRNRGVLWNETEQFRLGAAGDSDPFSTQMRYTISGEVEPSATYTFTLTLKAPSAVGTYTTDWRMLREDVTWFGPTVSKAITVVDQTPDTEPPTAPTNLTATLVGGSQIDLAWTAATDNIGVVGYKVYRNGSLLTNCATTAYSNTSLSSGDTFTYQVSAYDSHDNESALSDTASATTPVVKDIIIDNGGATFTGSWSTGTDTTTKYGADYVYGPCSPSNGRIARWIPDIDLPGMYLVYVWYASGANRSVKAPYTVIYNGTSTTVQVDQTTNGGKWNSIGLLPFVAGISDYVKLANGTGEPASTVVVADAVRFFYVRPFDTTPPTIDSVTASPRLVSGGLPVRISVSANDNVGVTSVTANGSNLTLTGGSAWSGAIDTDPELGEHIVTVTASDAAGNEAVSTAQSYVTARVFGLANVGLRTDGPTQAGATQYLYKTWGSVTRLDSDYFDLSDGSPTPVRVYCPGHGLTTGRFVSVVGVWNTTTSPAQLDVQPSQIGIIY